LTSCGRRNWRRSVTIKTSPAAGAGDYARRSKINQIQRGTIESHILFVGYFGRPGRNIVREKLEALVRDRR
jgi:hypothetical protein